MGVGCQPHAPSASTHGKDPVPILQEARWAQGPVWTGGKSRPHRDSILDRPARSQSLYRLSYRPTTRKVRRDLIKHFVTQLDYISYLSVRFYFAHLYRVPLHPPTPPPPTFFSQNWNDSSKAVSCSVCQKIPSCFKIWEFIDFMLVRWTLWRRATRWRSWLRHCTTSRKIAGSIADVVIGIFHWLNPSGRATSLGSTQLQGHRVGSRGGRYIGVTTSPPSCAYCSEIRATCKSRSPKDL